MTSIFFSHIDAIYNFFSLIVARVAVDLIFQKDNNPQRAHHLRSVEFSERWTEAWKIDGDKGWSPLSIRESKPDTWAICSR